MATESPDTALIEQLEEAGQSHLVRQLRELDTERAERLRQQLRQLDWRRLRHWVDQYVLGDNPQPSLPQDIRPAAYHPLEPASPDQRSLYEKAREQAENLLRNGEVAAFTVAGGQGTRLGFDAPKGTFPISPVRKKSLFQLFAEAMLRAQEKHDVVLSWYIMTSPLNDADTREFFEEHDFFGLEPDQVMFFPQGTLPAVDFEGRVLLAAPDRLALSPDGHGGSLAAMRNSGALDDMKERGIRHISYFQVDNPLVHVFDPLFIGLHALLGAEMSSRCLEKTGPTEKLGNFCLVDGTLCVVEYSDMPEELAEQHTADGRLRFRPGSPAIHVLDRTFVERLTEGGLDLPVHRAVKKVPYVDSEGTRIEPKEPNAVKFEMFVFDAIPEAKDPLILQADRDEQFAPLKNQTGPDSVDSVRDRMVRRAARWLEAAGIEVPREPDGTPACVIELSPRTFLDRNDVLLHKESLRAPARNAQEVYE